jgi:alkylhydroperoxidase family enzyme
VAVAQAFNPSTREAKASLVVYRERESSRTVRITQRKSCLNTHTHLHKEKGRRKERLERGGT